MVALGLVTTEHLEGERGHAGRQGWGRPPGWDGGRAACRVGVRQTQWVSGPPGQAAGPECVPASCWEAGPRLGSGHEEDRASPHPRPAGSVLAGTPVWYFLLSLEGPRGGPRTQTGGTAKR